MKKLIQVREQMYRMVNDITLMPKELNEIEQGKRLEGYEVSRGGFGIVVLRFPDGEVHYVPSGDKISEITFKYEDGIGAFKMEEEEKVMTVKDLIAYLNVLPQDAELFFYSGFGGFLSLDSMEQIETYFEFNDKENTVYLDNARYESENMDRLAQGKEWSEWLRETK